MAIPEQCPVPGIAAYRKHAEPGTVLEPAKLSGEKIGSVLATGGSRSEVEKALADAMVWFEQAVVIQTEAERT